MLFFSSMYLVVVLVMFCPWCALGQIRCEQIVNNFILLNTSTSSVNMSCSVPDGVILSQPEQFQWEWLRLGPGSTLQNFTTDVTSGRHTVLHCSYNSIFFFYLERDVSIYTHTVQCTSTGLYQALYHNASSNECLFSCYFVVSEVRETRPEVLRDNLAAYGM